MLMNLKYLKPIFKICGLKVSWTKDGGRSGFGGCPLWVKSPQAEASLIIILERFSTSDLIDQMNSKNYEI